MRPIRREITLFNPPPRCAGSHLTTQRVFHFIPWHIIYSGLYAVFHIDLTHLFYAETRYYTSPRRCFNVLNGLGRYCAKLGCLIRAGAGTVQFYVNRRRTVVILFLDTKYNLLLRRLSLE